MEPNETNETSSILSLEVTQEQKEAIYHFFAHNDWDFKEVQIPPNNVCTHFIPNFHGNFDYSRKNLHTKNKKTFSQPQMHNDTR
jgi:hypothetical protein